MCIDECSWVCMNVHGYTRVYIHECTCMYIGVNEYICVYMSTYAKTPSV